MIVHFRLYIAIGCMVLVAVLPAWAAESQLYHIAFMNRNATIAFSSVKTPDGESIEAVLFQTPNAAGKKIIMDSYYPEGGSAPEIKSVFVSGHAPRKLFVIVAWSADAPAMNTAGTIYQVRVYSERTKIINGRLQPIPDSKLTRRFGTGFERIREGDRVTYTFKTAPDVKRQLIKWGYK